MTLGDIPGQHRELLASQIENAAGQLQVLMSSLRAAQPTMPVSTAYDGLCTVQRELDHVAVDIAKYGE